jgi:hypothetical protein
MTASFTLLLGVAVLLWLATVANTISIKSSDAAGNALSQAFGVLMAIALFVLLAIVLVLGVVRGEMPAWMASRSWCWSRHRVLQQSPRSKF